MSTSNNSKISELKDKLAHNILNGIGIITLAFVALCCIYILQYSTFVEIKVEPGVDELGQSVSPQVYADDKVMIVDNCESTSVHKIPEQTIKPAPIVVPFKGEVSIPYFRGIGFQGASLDTSIETLSDTHLDEIIEQHRKNISADLYANINAVVRPELAKEHVSQQLTQELAKELSGRFPIGETTIPDLEVPSGHLSITTLRWQRTWEQGVATIKRPRLPFLQFIPFWPFGKSEERLGYMIETDSNLIGVTTDQLTCDQDLKKSLEQVFAKHYKAGDQNTARAILEQIKFLDPGNQEPILLENIIDDSNVVGGIAQQGQFQEGQLKEGQDLAIRESPCFPGIEGDSTQNYKGALRDNEVVTVLSNPVPDECGYNMRWLYVKTLEGREGYVSAAYILIPEFEIRVTPQQPSNF